MVYIDDFNAPFGKMRMCHMIADNTTELLKMAALIGIHAMWIQDKGTYNEHFDVCLSKKEKAIAAGAVEITARQYAAMVNQRKDKPAANNIKLVYCCKEPQQQKLL